VIYDVRKIEFLTENFVKITSHFRTILVCPMDWQTYTEKAHKSITHSIALL